MRSGFINIRSPAIISLFLVLPFAAAELVSTLTDGTQLSGSRHLLDMTVLFGLMWILAAVFMVILIQIAGDVRAGSSLANPPWLIVRLGALSLLPWYGRHRRRPIPVLHGCTQLRLRN